MTRTAMVGGVPRRRSIVGGSRSKLENRLIVAGMALGVAVWLVLGGMPGLVAGLVVGATPAALLWHFVDQRSVAELMMRAWRWRSRRRAGLTVFVPAPAVPVDGTSSSEAASAVPATAPGGVGLRAVRAVPDGVGAVSMYAYTAPNGERLGVLHHRNTGQDEYLSAVLSIDGAQAGLREERAYDQEAANTGRLLAALARESSLVRGVQWVNRVTPLDSSAHERYIRDKVASLPTRPPDELLRSYDQLVRMTQQVSEEHRNYLVIRLPFTARFADAARDRAPGQEGWCALVYDELIRVARLAHTAGMPNGQPMSERRLAGLIRSQQNPDFLINELPEDFASCWRPSTTARRHVLVDDKWATRVAWVSPAGVTPEPVNMRWLSPLLTEVSPAVIRTVSVLVDLVPAAKARAEAVQDVTVDRGNLHSKAADGIVSDGTNEVQVSASRQRLEDLKPGRGHHGARWSMYVAITAAGEAEVLRASAQIEERASECGLSQLSWLDDEHDVAQVTCWPMWRGMAVPKIGATARLLSMGGR